MCWLAFGRGLANDVVMPQSNCRHLPLLNAIYFKLPLGVSYHLDYVAKIYLQKLHIDIFLVFCYSLGFFLG